MQHLKQARKEDDPIKYAMRTSERIQSGQEGNRGSAIFSEDLQPVQSLKAELRHSNNDNKLDSTA
jgi:hypothetical protein